MANTEAGIKYPNIVVQLSGLDGNAAVLIGTVRRALVRQGVPADEVTAFSTEATSGDYDNVIQTCMRWVNVI